MNDNEAARPNAQKKEPDAHGQAAMLLVESLIHGLVEHNVISVADAVEIVQVATDVKIEMADDLGDSPETLRHSLTLLSTISASLQQDV